MSLYGVHVNHRHWGASANCSDGCRQEEPGVLHGVAVDRSGRTPAGASELALISGRRESCTRPLLAGPGGGLAGFVDEGCL